MRIQDRFLYFTYNGIHSSEYDVFYTNYGEDISFPFSSNVKATTVNPLFQQRTMLVGTSKESKVFKLDLAAGKRSIEDIEEIYQWLTSEEIGTLSFDFRGNYQFKVVLKNIGEPTIIPYEFTNGVIETIIKFSVEFETIGDHRPETNKKYVLSDNVALEPDTLLPIAIHEDNKVKLINWEKSSQDMEFISASNDKLIIDEGDKRLFNYIGGAGTGNIVRVKTDVGALLDKDDKNIFITYPRVEAYSNGPVTLDSYIAYSGIIKGTKVSATEVEIEAPWIVKNDEYCYSVKDEKEYEKKYFDRHSPQGLIGLYNIIRNGNSFEIVVPEYGFAKGEEGKLKIKHEVKDTAIGEEVRLEIKVSKTTDITGTYNISTIRYKKEG